MASSFRPGVAINLKTRCLVAPKPGDIGRVQDQAGPTAKIGTVNSGIPITDWKGTPLKDLQKAGKMPPPYQQAPVHVADGIGQPRSRTRYLDEAQADDQQYPVIPQQAIAGSSGRLQSSPDQIGIQSQRDMHRVPSSPYTEESRSSHDFRPISRQSSRSDRTLAPTPEPNQLKLDDKYMSRGAQSGMSGRLQPNPNQIGIQSPREMPVVPPSPYPEDIDLSRSSRSSSQQGAQASRKFAIDPARAAHPLAQSARSQRFPIGNIETRISGVQPDDIDPSRSFRSTSQHDNQASRSNALDPARAAHPLAQSIRSQRFPTGDAESRISGVQQSKQPAVQLSNPRTVSRPEQSHRQADLSLYSVSSRGKDSKRPAPIISKAPQSILSRKNDHPSQMAVNGPGSFERRRSEHKVPVSMDSRSSRKSSIASKSSVASPVTNAQDLPQMSPMPDLEAGLPRIMTSRSVRSQRSRPSANMI